MSVLHDFTCLQDHLFERFVDVAQLKVQRCPVCRSPAEVVFLPRRLANAPATIYYINQRGERLYPWDSRELPQKLRDAGYVRQEVSAFERDRWANEVRQEMNQQTEHQHELEQQRSEADRKQRHAELRDMSRHWDRLHRDIAREAMEQENRESIPTYDSEFRIGG